MCVERKVGKCVCVCVCVRVLRSATRLHRGVDVLLEEDDLRLIDSVYEEMVGSRAMT